MPEDSFGSIKSEVGRFAKDVAREMVVDPLRNAGRLTKEGLIDTKDAIVASGKVLFKEAQELANKLGIHVPEQGPVSVAERIYPTVAYAAFASFLSSGGGFLAWGVIKGIQTGQPEMATGLAVASAVHLGLGAMEFTQAYRYAMGKEDLQLYVSNPLK